MSVIKLGSYEFHDGAWYAFSPNFINVTGLQSTALTEIDVTIGGQAIKSQVFGSSGRIDISGLLQNLWSSTNWNDLSSVETVKHPTITLKIGNSTTTITGKFDVIYGSQNLGESFCAWGAALKYYPASKKFTRRVAKWYSKLPCELSFMRVVIQQRTESSWAHSKRVANLTIWQRIDGDERKWSNLFTDPSVTTVQKLAGTNTLLKYGGDITITTALVDSETPNQSFETEYIYYEDKSTDGYYLRWIDNNGLVNYYLFDKGKVSTKTKSVDTIDREVVDNGNYYPSANVDTERNVEVTLKCSATCLNEDLYNTVKTILRANMVQLYLGKSYNDTGTAQRDVWLPVRLATGTETEEEKKMKDLDISIVLPKYHSQSL